MRLLYGHEYQASRIVFAALGSGVALYLIAATLSQALLALDAGCASSGCLGDRGDDALVGSYALLPGAELTRVAVSFAAASLVLLIGLATSSTAALGARHESSRDDRRRGPRLLGAESRAGVRRAARGPAHTGSATWTRRRGWPRAAGIPDAQVTDSYDDLLNDDELDAIVVATPPIRTPSWRSRPPQRQARLRREAARPQRARRRPCNG